MPSLLACRQALAVHEKMVPIRTVQYYESMGVPHGIVQEGIGAVLRAPPHARPENLSPRPAWPAGILSFYPADWSPCAATVALSTRSARVPRHTLAAVMSRELLVHIAYTASRTSTSLSCPTFHRGAPSPPRWGLSRREGTSERSLFVIDGGGVVRWSTCRPVHHRRRGIRRPSKTRLGPHSP